MGVYVLVRQQLPDGAPEVLAAFRSLGAAIRHANRFYAIHPESWSVEYSGQEWQRREMIDSGLDCLFIIARRVVEDASRA